MNIQFAIREDKTIAGSESTRKPYSSICGKDHWRTLGQTSLACYGWEKLAGFNLTERHLPHVAVKEAVFPFARFPRVDVFLGPEMKSTGEVMGIDTDFGRVFAKSQLGAGPICRFLAQFLFQSKMKTNQLLLKFAKILSRMDQLATGGTTAALHAAGVPATRINKVMEGRPHAVDAMLSGDIQLVFNTAKGAGAIKDPFHCVIRL